MDRVLAGWLAGDPVGVATVVRTFRSAPRPAGASMAVLADGSVVGSVSGGCVEGALYDAVRVGATGLHHFGVTDDDALAVGLTCGGSLDVLVETVSAVSFPDFAAVAADIADHRPVAVATIIEHPDGARVGARIVVRPGDSSGTLGSPRVDAAVVDDARGLLESGRTDVLRYEPDGMSVFVNSFTPTPRMIVFGCTDFASALTKQGALLGFRVTVCDARPVFTTPERFPGADDVVVDWPHRYLERESAAGRIDDRTVLCVVTHDPKFDVPLLEVALRLPHVGYVGAMGSRRTHDDRLARLREVGVTDDELSLLSSPIGLDLGARTPEETAVSIAAEIVARRWGGDGRPLGDRDGRIHH